MAAKTILVLGGGWGGLTSAHRVRDLLSSDAELISQFLQGSIRQWQGVVSTQTLLPGVSMVKDL